LESLDDYLLKFDAPEIIFGFGALKYLGNCCRRLGGERIFLVTDPGIVEAGWVDESLKHLEAEGLRYVVYDNVVSNPRDFQMEQGAQLYWENKCDVIAAVGGGSPIDTAKGVATLVSNHGRLYQYVGCNLVTQPIPPLICVPSTAGTGADVSQFAIFTDTREGHVKRAILSRAIMPDISLIDPRLLFTKPRSLIAATGMDALTHAIEAYVSSLAWSLTDPHALHAIELVALCLQNATERKDKFSMRGMAIASLEAGLAFSNAILGAVHALAHPLGGLYDLHHGVINSVLLPVVIEHNLKYSIEKYAKIAGVLGRCSNGMSPEEAAGQVPEIIRELSHKLGMPTRLTELGVKAEDIPQLAVLARDDICMDTNPYSYSTHEIEEIYHEVL
jgi:alcohol dehydrogenase class IV